MRDPVGLSSGESSSMGTSRKSGSSVSGGGSDNISNLLELGLENSNWNSTVIDHLSKILEMDQNSTDSNPDEIFLAKFSLEEFRCYNDYEDTNRSDIPQEFQFTNPNISSRGSESDTVVSNSSGSILLNNTSSSSPWLGHVNPTLDHTNHNTSLVYCPRNYDKVLCWPETLTKLNATLPCFSEFNGIRYDASYNATRYCDNGTWDKTDYTLCPALKTTPPATDNGDLEITTDVYFYGYCLSLSALITAMVIFLVLKELRCLRNIIHTNLIVTYILSDAMWIITSFTTTVTSTNPDPQSQPGAHSNQISCITFIMLHYFHLTNFFWMFVEGLYLYVLVVQTFVAENIKLRVYAGIGWGLPLMVVIGWSIAKWMTQSASADIQATDAEYNMSTCLWLMVSVYDWIYKAPVIIVLAANMIFLIQIMWVLITKLRSATSPETQQSRKAAKALVVLMPLLGITYVLILSGSKTAVYEHLRALLISTQGFLVALLYCFLNGEVRLAVRHRWNRLRTLGFRWAHCTCCCECDRADQIHHTRDLSPRTATESIRFYGANHAPNRQRDSTVSETTLTTTLQGSLNGNSSAMGSSIRLSSSTMLSSLHKSPSTHTNVPLTVENNLYM